MLRVTGSGQVLVRRAADHITGPAFLSAGAQLLFVQRDGFHCHGGKMSVAGLQITKQTADIRVETAAYWRMEKYNDFETGQRVSVNGVPCRRYHGKEVPADRPARRSGDRRDLHDDHPFCSTRCFAPFSQRTRRISPRSRPVKRRSRSHISSRRRGTCAWRQMYLYH